MMPPGTTRRALLGAALAGAAAPAWAQPAYPAQTVTMIVPFAPGGGTDVLARLLAQQMTQAFGRSVVVENRPGGAGKTGTEFVQRAAPDGYTLVMASTGAILASTGVEHPIKVREVLAPVTLAAAPAYVVVVHPALQVSDIRGLVAAAKRRPGQIAFGSSGVGAASHLAGELFADMAGVELLHVPYRGTGQALNDLIAGRIQVMFAPPPTVDAAVRGNMLKVIGITSEQPSPLYPNYRPVAQDVPGYSAVGWFGLLAPKNTPQPIIDRLQGTAAAALDSPASRQRLAELGAEPQPMRPDEFADYIDADLTRWRNLIRARHIPME